MKIRSYAFALVFLGFVVAILLPVSPAANAIPHRDSGVFLYTGERILHGDLPYQDIWDHKPPTIHYLNALGLLLGQGSWWGVWFLECVAITVTFGTGYALLRREFGQRAALAAMSCVAAALLILNDGNMVEEFALPFQFGALWLFTSTKERSTRGWRGYLLGVLMGITFLLRQNLIGVWIAIGLYELVAGTQTRPWRSTLTRLAVMSLGFGSVMAVMVGYFAARGGLNALWSAAFYYNLTYIAEFSTLGAFANFIYGFLLVLASGMPLLAIITWGLIVNRLRQGETHLTQSKPLVSIALLGLPLEFALTAVSQRLYGHYFVAWLPLMAVLTAYAVQYLLAMIQSRTVMAHQNTLTAAFLAGVCGLLIVTAWLSAWKRTTPTGDDLVELICAVSDEDDTVLMWGADAAINFESGRKSPTRYVYQYPLYTPHYQRSFMVSEFLADLRQNPPAVIVDDRRDLQNIPPLDEELRNSWSPKDYVPLPDMDAVYTYIATQYAQVETVGSDNQWVYVRLKTRDSTVTSTAPMAKPHSD